MTKRPRLPQSTDSASRSASYEMAKEIRNWTAEDIATAKQVLADASTHLGHLPASVSVFLQGWAPYLIEAVAVNQRRK